MRMTDALGHQTDTQQTHNRHTCIHICSGITGTTRIAPVLAVDKTHHGLREVPPVAPSSCMVSPDFLGKKYHFPDFSSIYTQTRRDIV